MSGFRVAGLSIVRSWSNHRVRLVATFLALGLSTTLIGSIVSVERSVTRAVTAASTFESVDADVLVTARSGAGLADHVRQRIERQDPDVTVVGVVRAHTRVGRSSDPAMVVGSDLTSDGVVVGRELAQAEGLRVGVSLRVATPDGWQMLPVDRIEDTDVNDGRVVLVSLAAARRLFDRGDQTDAFLLNTTRPDLIDALRAELGDYVLVERPEDFSAPELESFATVRSVLALVTGVAFIGAILVLMVVWRRLLADEHDRFAALRLAGVGRRALAGASLAVLVSMAVAGSLLGIVGTLGASFLLRPLISDLVAVTGVAAPPAGGIDLVPLVVAVAVTILGGIVVWAITIRAVLRVSPLSALRLGVGEAKPGSGAARSLELVALGGAALTLALLVAGPGAAPVGLAAGLVAGALLPASLARPMGALVRRAQPVPAMVAGAEIGRHRSRSALLAGLAGLAVLLPVVMLTLAGNLRDEVDASVRAWARSGGFVTAAPAGEALRDQRIGESGLSRIAAVPGVDRVDRFVTTAINQPDGTILLVWGWDVRGGTPDVRLRVTDGVGAPDELWDRLQSGEVAVSRQIAVSMGLQAGDRFPWPGRDGLHRVRVAAVFDDAVTDSGLVVTSSDTIAELTGEHRTYDAMVAFDGSRPAQEVLTDIRTSLEPAYPDLFVTDADGTTERILSVVDRVLTVLQALAWLTVALVATVIAVSVSGARRDRQQSIGSWRLAGLSPRAVLGSLVLEVAVLAVGAGAIGALWSRVVAGHGFAMLDRATGIAIRPTVLWPQLVAVLFGTVAATVVGAVLPTRPLRQRSLVAVMRTADD